MGRSLVAYTESLSDWHGLAEYGRLRMIVKAGGTALGQVSKNKHWSKVQNWSLRGLPLREQVRAADAEPSCSVTKQVPQLLGLALYLLRSTNSLLYLD